MQSLWHYRRFVWQTALDDFRYRYAGASLGIFWNVATPLAMLAIYTLVFTGLLAPRLTGSNRLAVALIPLYLGSGFLPWGAFAECVTRGTHAFITNAAYLKKMAVPEQVFVAQSAVSAVLTMLIAVGLLIALALLLGQPAELTWLLLPVVVVVWQSFGFGLGLLLGTLNVFFRDIAQVVTVVLQIWMWSVPVVYVEDVLPAAYRATLPFNPAYPFLVAFRDLFLYGQVSATWVWLAMAGWLVVSVGAGSLLLRVLRPEVRDLV